MARGDLGVEIPMETLTNVQKDLVRRSNLGTTQNLTPVPTSYTPIPTPTPTPDPASVPIPAPALAPYTPASIPVVIIYDLPRMSTSHYLSTSNIYPLVISTTSNIHR